MNELKRCCDCGLHKPLDQFNKRNTRGRKGHLNYCKPCLSVRWKRWAHDPLQERKHA